MPNRTGPSGIALVATSQSLLALDLATGVARVVDTGRGLYYGIGYSDEALFVGARHGFVADKEDRSREDGSILVYDYDLQLREVLKAPFPLRDIHQIAFHAGRLWVACSYDDLIAIYDGRHWERWYPALQDDAQPDRYHFNSIFFDGDELYLLAHQYGPSAAWRCDARTLTVLEKIPLGEKAHNLWKLAGVLHACSSGSGAIESAGGWRLSVGAFPRGVAITEDLILVGLSEVAERQRRGLTTGSVRVFDREWNLLRDIRLPGHGLVLEIRLPGRRDLCNPDILGRPVAASAGPALALPVTVPGPPAQTAPALLETAEQFLQAGNLVAAQQCLREARRVPDHGVRLARWHARALSGLGQPGERPPAREVAARLARLATQASGRPLDSAAVLDLAVEGGRLVAATPRGFQAALQPAASAPRLQIGNPHLPFAAGTFDLVTCFGWLEHFLEVRDALREMVRVLKENGRLLLLTQALWRRWPGPLPQLVEPRLAPEAWPAALAECGLSVVSQRLTDEDEPLRAAWPGYILLISRKADRP